VSPAFLFPLSVPPFHKKPLKAPFHENPALMLTFKLYDHHEPLKIVKDTIKKRKTTSFVENEAKIG